MIAMFLACIYTMGANAYLRQIGLERGFEPASRAAALAFLSAATVILIITHEGGHRIAGAAMGFRCVRFGFGPFEFYQEGRGWKTQRVKMLWGAFVRQMPSGFAHFRRQKAITLLSGPTSSLVFGTVFLAIALTSSSSVEYALFSRLGFVSLLGVLELMPFEKNGIGSDGYRLLQVLRGGPPIDDMLREMLTETSNFTPVRYRDWPHAVVVRLAAVDDPYNLYLAYLHTLDAGDTAAASGYMQRLMALLPEEKPYPHYAWEAAYWLAAYTGDAPGARRWMERAGQNVDPELRLRAEAAVALAEGRPDDAQNLAEQALVQMYSPTTCGSGKFEAECLEHMLRTPVSGAVRC